YVVSTNGGASFGSPTVAIANNAQTWIKSASNPGVRYDSVNSRWGMIFSNFDSSGLTSQTGIAYASSLSGTWTLCSANPMTTMQFGTGSYDGRSLVYDSVNKLWHAFGQAGTENGNLDQLVITENFHWTNPDYTTNNWTKVQGDVL